MHRPVLRVTSLRPLTPSCPNHLATRVQRSDQKEGTQIDQSESRMCRLFSRYLACLSCIDVPASGATRERVIMFFCSIFRWRRRTPSGRRRFLPPNLYVMRMNGRSEISIAFKSPTRHDTPESQKATTSFHPKAPMETPYTREPSTSITRYKLYRIPLPNWSIPRNTDSSTCTGRCANTYLDLHMLRALSY